ncbi:MAG: DnaD domain protein [Oscillospiraceae bacterium]|jgi:DnaD/phage-associated family protein
MLYRLARKFDAGTLPREFVERYRSVDCDTLRVGVWVLCNGRFDAELLSSELSIPLKSAEKAVEFWLNAGLIVSTEDNAGKESVTVADPVAVPRLSHMEIAQLSVRDPHVARLVQESQRILGRNLTAAEAARLISVYNFYDFDPEVLLMMLEYAKPRSKRSPFAYLERTAQEWNSLGIKTQEAAEARLRFLEKREKEEEEASELLELDKALTWKEKSLIDAWYEDLGYGSAMIREAYLHTGKSSVAYINSVLRSWYEKGYRTPEDARKTVSNAPAAQPKKSTGKKSGKSILKWAVDNSISD